ncbi:MAG: hypothetical protein KDI55_28695 [Anaerolineae bacterium]|nr:hypothetical protein [Anaerolineae bacterium]
MFKSLTIYQCTQQVDAILKRLPAALESLPFSGGVKAFAYRHPPQLGWNFDELVVDNFAGGGGAGSERLPRFLPHQG